MDDVCRNITELRGLEPPATVEEIVAAARLSSALPQRRQPPKISPPLRRLAVR